MAWKTCPACKGSGESSYGAGNCMGCGGSGEIEQPDPPKKGGGKK